MSDKMASHSSKSTPDTDPAAGSEANEGTSSNGDASPPVTTANPEDNDLSKRKKKYYNALVIPKLKDDEYHLQCEWGKCDFVSNHMKSFTDHVSKHINQYFAQVPHSVASSAICFTCGWRDCGAQILGSLIDFNRHVYYHVYHVRLKCLGANMARALDLGPCMLGSQSCNWIPELPDNLQCLWEGCQQTCIHKAEESCTVVYLGYGREGVCPGHHLKRCHRAVCLQIIFDNPYTFYTHVSHHCDDFPNGNNAHCNCHWKGCKTRVNSKHKLRDHIRMHTQEKQVACPTCGGLFANRTKLTDHILRQAITSAQRYECSHCSRRFATERMLREHMRRHVNHYKCPMCEMTCPCPSALTNHLRYKHSEEKPFKCGHCEFSAKSSADLRKHLDSHNVEDQFSCHIANCPFSARSYTSLDLHFKKHHQSEDGGAAQYMCHVCSRLFVRGSSLTYHLKKKHLFHWPPGHSRFRYKLHPDGFLRLQTVRYESVEVSEAAFSNAPAADTAVPTKSRRKKCIITANTAITAPASPSPQHQQQQQEDDGAGTGHQGAAETVPAGCSCAAPSGGSIPAAVAQATRKTGKRKKTAQGKQDSSKKQQQQQQTKRKEKPRESGLAAGSGRPGDDGAGGGNVGDSGLRDGTTSGGEPRKDTAAAVDVAGILYYTVPDCGEEEAASRHHSSPAASLHVNLTALGCLAAPPSACRASTPPSASSSSTASSVHDAASVLSAGSILTAPLLYSATTAPQLTAGTASWHSPLVTHSTSADASGDLSRAERSPTTKSGNIISMAGLIEDGSGRSITTTTTTTTAAAATAEDPALSSGSSEADGAQLLPSLSSSPDSESSSGGSSKRRRAAEEEEEEEEDGWWHSLGNEASDAYPGPPPAKRRALAEDRPTLRRANSLDECPPEMLEISWQEKPPSGPEPSPGSSSSSSSSSACVRSEVSDDSYTPTPAGVGLGLVAEYGDLAEANLHMLGDVALTTLRVPKGKTPGAPSTTRSTRANPR